MLSLPDVTLVMIETREHELARLAIEECLAKVKFGDVLVFSDRVLIDVEDPNLIRFVEVPDWPDKEGWSRFNWHGVGPYIKTSHALTIQWDSWVWDVTKWTDEYLEYDYVGAPWWYKDYKNVGNGGFALRSKRLLRHVYDHRAEYPVETNIDDDLFCRKYRTQLELAGMRWAPERLAKDFSFECTRPSPMSKHFGFHAAFNFDEVLDADALYERAKLMHKSQYIQSQPHIWETFCKKNSLVVESF
jgi:hypothetical protein